MDPSIRRVVRLRASRISSRTKRKALGLLTLGASRRNKVRLNRADPSCASRESFSVIESGLSEVYPVDRDTEDDGGWLFEPGYPPSYGAFGRMRGALTVRSCLAIPSERTLEVAAGGGGLTAALAGAGRNVVVNDLLVDTLSESLALYEIDRERVTIIGGNVFDLEPEALGVFDLVIASEVIEHVAHPDQLLAQLGRFLAPGGRIVLTTPNGSFFRNVLPTFSQIEDPGALESEQFKPDADGHLFLLTPDELETLTIGAGLKVESMYVWATPMLTGHAGMRHLAGRWFIPVARATEWLAQRIPAFVRRRICYSLVATLVKA